MASTVSDIGTSKGAAPSPSPAAPATQVEPKVATVEDAEDAPDPDEDDLDDLDGVCYAPMIRWKLTSALKTCLRSFPL